MTEEKKQISVTMPLFDYEYYIEHAREKKRTIQNLILFALKRYCDINPLPREKEEKEAKKRQIQTGLPQIQYGDIDEK
jgi:hypothetical protein